MSEQKYFISYGATPDGYGLLDSERALLREGVQIFMFRDAGGHGYAGQNYASAYVPTAKFTEHHRKYTECIAAALRGECVILTYKDFIDWQNEQGEIRG